VEGAEVVVQALFVVEEKKSGRILRSPDPNQFVVGKLGEVHRSTYSCR
jgi:hypothetical protein